MNLKLHEGEELVLVKNMVLHMTWKKLVNRNSKVLCSQGSLGVIKDFIADENGKLNGVEIIIVPPGIRVLTEIGDDWKKTTDRLRTTQPINS